MSFCSILMTSISLITWSLSVFSVGQLKLHQWNGWELILVSLNVEWEEEVAAELEVKVELVLPFHNKTCDGQFAFNATINRGAAAGMMYCSACNARFTCCMPPNPPLLYPSPNRVSCAWPTAIAPNSTGTALSSGPNHRQTFSFNPIIHEYCLIKNFMNHPLITDRPSSDIYCAARVAEEESKREVGWGCIRRWT